MRATTTILTMLTLLVLGQTAGAQSVQVPLDLSAEFNVDAVCGPKEFQICIADGTQDLVDLFGSLEDGNGNFILAAGLWVVGASNGLEYTYSIPGYASGHPLYYTAADGLPADGVISGADRIYHMPSIHGNATLVGDWTETADPSDFSLQPNCITAGALHNKSTWQVASVIVELPAAQKGSYQDINLVLAAQDAGANGAMNMRLVALYGPDGADEAILFDFDTDTPEMTEAAPAGYLAVHPFGQHYSSYTGSTGAVRTPGGSYFEFDGALALDPAKDLWGIRIEDTNPDLNWAPRGVTIFAATATKAAGANTAPVADAGPDQAVIDNDEDGSEDITLDGSASSDADGVLLTHVWTEGAPQVAVGVNPIVTLAFGPHTLTLTVTDGDGVTDTDTVQIDINPVPPGAPVADAGPDQTVTDLDDSGDEVVTLDGSGSSDPDGTIVSWVWTEGGPQIATGETTPVTLAVGIHTITLTVTDNDTRTRTDTVIVTVKPYVPPMTYYVDPDDGDDNDSGGTGDPCATLGHAVSLAGFGDTIILRDGIYREYVSLSSSGYAGSPITIRPDDGASPILSGATEVTSWTQCTLADAGNNPNYASIYYADIPGKPVAMYEDNAPLTMARTEWRHPADGGSGTTLYDPTNITEPDGYWEGAELFIWIRSGTTYAEREILTHTGSTISFTDLGYSRTAKAEDFYYLRGKVELIDGPGQWAFEEDGGGSYRVFVWSSDDADPSTHLIEATIEGAGSMLINWNSQSHWVIDGLELRHSAGHGVGSWTDGGNNITVSDCMIHHNKSTGVYGRYNVDGVYSRNYVGHNDLGIQVGDTSDGVLVEENEIAWGDVDGLIITADDVTVRRNYIHDHWAWGHADNCQTYSGVADLLFEENFIFNSGQSIMMESTDGVTFRNNAIVSCHANMVIAGHSNTFNVFLEGNTLMFAGGSAVNTSGDRFFFNDNIFFAGTDAGAYGVDWTVHTAFTSDYNLFYTADGIREVVGHAPPSWYADLVTFQAASGLEANSAYGNPQFVNAPVSQHLVDAYQLVSFTPTRVYMVVADMHGLAVGDHIELDWDGVVRTITALGGDYIEFDPPKPSVVTFKAGVVINWKTNTDYTMDLSPAAGSPAIGLATGGGDCGSTIDIPDFRTADFDGDGVCDVPRWGAAPAAKPGDADGDGDVDLDDFVILKSNFGQDPLVDDRADFDNDGDVDLDDFVILKSNFGT